MPIFVADIALVDDLLGLARREDALRQAVLRPVEFDVGGWVVEDVVAAGQPLEPGTDATTPLVLGLESSRGCRSALR